MKVLFQNLQLIISLTKRELEQKYKHSLLGFLWVLVYPVFMLAIYSFVFGTVFRAKWGVVAGESYSLFMFLGLITHGLMAESILKSTGLIQGQANYVKKVIFPLEVLGWVALLSAVFQFSICFGVFVVFFILAGKTITFSFLWLPLILIPFVILNYALILFVSSLGVYLKDTPHVATMVVSVLLFMSPVFYPVEAVPEAYRFILYLNPLTFVIESLRGSVMVGMGVSLQGLVVYSLCCSLTYIFARWWFNKVKVGFSDVI